MSESKYFLAHTGPADIVAALGRDDNDGNEIRARLGAMECEDIAHYKAEFSLAKIKPVPDIERLRRCLKMEPWHHEYTCDEYDAYRADPHHFRSEAQIRAAAEYTRALAEEEQRRQMETRRQLLELRREQERIAARERAEREEARRLEEQRARHARVAQLKAEEDASAITMARTTQVCPGCRAPIEKRGGWPM
ncbi:hypothetical protein GGR56DRAFT_675526 [Xylariaceae sp. FL0804]|nr:hypothetical protein GGR56DRAFT_675526 [Xylariaceae sp. FL0804]